jgi:succinoglycan biosynthesis protein ExoV
MKLLYFRDSNGNFGDDLNESIWRAVLPPRAFEGEDVLLMGIGSIFNEKLAPLSVTQGKRVFVLGSGAGYGPLPADWENWTILGVRGPLTAQLIGRMDLAITDSAALLGSLPGLSVRSDQRDATLLIPHYHSVLRGSWEKVAREAGMTFVDPAWPIPVVMEHFSRAKLVITEAMHGAIVADTLRLPWLPIVIAPDLLPFKWVDWTLSLDLPYSPVHVPASSTWEALHHRRLVQCAKRQGVMAPSLVDNMRNPDSLISDFRERYRVLTPDKKRVRRKGSKHFSSLMRSSSEILDRRFVENAARHLRTVASGRPYLSHDMSLARRIDQLHGAVDRFVRAIGC